MRHILVHGSYEVDLELVWSVADSELDQLETTVRTAQAALAAEDDLS